MWMWWATRTDFWRDRQATHARKLPSVQDILHFRRARRLSPGKSGVQDFSVSVLSVTTAKNGAARPTFGRRAIRGIASIVTLLALAEEAKVGRSFEGTQ